MYMEELRLAKYLYRWRKKKKEVGEEFIRYQILKKEKLKVFKQWNAV